MRSLILNTALRFIAPIMFLFSFFLLVRGHNNPGGGFIAGLVAAAAITLYTLSSGVSYGRRLLQIDARLLTGSGLLLALISGIPAITSGQSFMTGLWLEKTIIVIGKLGTPILFDAGVFMVVLGITSNIIFELMEHN
ncbi:MAG: Na+/H+ antiporter subunit B [Caldithrix sp.]|nr:Na+/H+ antiporter subunit B [Caldithrix sp.]